MLDQEWVNPVPYSQWKKYLSQKDIYDEKLQTYINNNQSILFARKETSLKNQGVIYLKKIILFAILMVFAFSAVASSHS